MSKGSAEEVGASAPVWRFSTAAHYPINLDMAGVSDSYGALASEIRVCRSPADSEVCNVVCKNGCRTGSNPGLSFAPPGGIVP